VLQGSSVAPEPYRACAMTGSGWLPRTACPRPRRQRRARSARSASCVVAARVVPEPCRACAMTRNRSGAPHAPCIDASAPSPRAARSVRSASRRPANGRPAQRAPSHRSVTHGSDFVKPIARAQRRRGRFVTLRVRRRAFRTHCGCIGLKVQRMRGPERRKAAQVRIHPTSHRAREIGATHAQGRARARAVRPRAVPQRCARALPHHRRRSE
jgi:hypothetical protein